MFALTPCVDGTSYQLRVSCYNWVTGCTVVRSGSGSNLVHIEQFVPSWENPKLNGQFNGKTSQKDWGLSSKSCWVSLAHVGRIWRFPEIGVPPGIIHFERWGFPKSEHPAVGGTPWLWKTPYPSISVYPVISSYITIISHKKRIPIDIWIFTQKNNHSRGM